MAKLSQLNLPIKDESTGQITSQTFDIGGKEYSAGYGISISNTDEIASTTFVGTQAEWDALTPTEQAAFDIINITDDYTPSTEIQISYVDSLPVSGIRDILYGLRSFGTPASATAADGFLDSVAAFTKTSLLPSGYEYTSATAEISLDDATYNNFSSIVYDGTKFVIDGETELALGDTLYYRVLSGITYYGGDANAQTTTPIGKDPVDVVADGNMNAVTSNAVADALDGKVDKVIGKGLSTEDYTTAEQTKLSGIESGAQVNVQPNWSQTTTSADDYIKNKPTTISGYGITNAYTKDEVDNIVSELVTSMTWKPAVATYSDIATTYPDPDEGWTVVTTDTNIAWRYTNGAWIEISANTIPVVTSSVNGLMTSAMLAKLNGIDVDDVLRTENMETIGGAASKAYSKYKFFIGTDGLVYEASDDIAQGDTLTVGTNCIKYNFNEVLTNLTYQLINTRNATVLENVDLNDYNRIGYYIWGGVAAPTVLNRPTTTNDAGVLWVMNKGNYDIDSAYLTQFVLLREKLDIYMRLYNPVNETWSAWTKIITFNDMKNVASAVRDVSTGGSEIYANSDLNDYGDPGLYIWGAASAANITNVPLNTAAFMTVYRLAPTSFKRQIVFARGDNRIYTRIYNGTTWGNWEQFLTSAGGTITDTLVVKPTTADATKTNNDVSSSIYPGLVKLVDKNGKNLSLLQSAIQTDGKIGTALTCFNYNTSGTAFTNKGITFLMDKSGDLSYVFSDPHNANAALGTGYGTCTTAAATAAKEVTMPNYVLAKNGIVSVKFTYDVPANATLNINGKGAKPIYHQGYALKASVLKANDTATFIYTSDERYDLISSSRDGYRQNQSANGLISGYTKNDDVTVDAMYIQEKSDVCIVSFRFWFTKDTTATDTLLLSGFKSPGGYSFATAISYDGTKIRHLYLAPNTSLSIRGGAFTANEKYYVNFVYIKG